MLQEKKINFHLKLLLCWPLSNQTYIPSNTYFPLFPHIVIYKYTCVYIYIYISTNINILSVNIHTHKYVNIYVCCCCLLIDWDHIIHTFLHLAFSHLLVVSCGNHNSIHTALIYSFCWIQKLIHSTIFLIMSFHFATCFSILWMMLQ